MRPVCLSRPLEWLLKVVLDPPSHKKILMMTKIIDFLFHIWIQKMEENLKIFRKKAREEGLETISILKNLILNGTRNLWKSEGNLGVFISAAFRIERTSLVKDVWPKKFWRGCFDEEFDFTHFMPYFLQKLSSKLWNSSMSLQFFTCLSKTRFSYVFISCMAFFKVLTATWFWKVQTEQILFLLELDFF